jgi:18S rRNA (adenine1779-N6/adenine1780-N6)-dimethyltransferase
MQIRLVFNRKNKTLRSVLMTRSVFKLLEDNRKTVQSLKSGGDDDAVMDDRSVAQILEDILEHENWKGKRASKLDQDDFLQLLAEFNAAGIHFS